MREGGRRREGREEGEREGGNEGWRDGWREGGREGGGWRENRRIEERGCMCEWCVRGCRAFSYGEVFARRLCAAWLLLGGGGGGGGSGGMLPGNFKNRCSDYAFWYVTNSVLARNLRQIMRFILVSNFVKPCISSGC